MKKKLCILLMACFSISPLFAFIVSDIVHTALTEVTQAQASIKQVAQLQTMINDYKNQLRQIENYMKQIEGMDFSSLDGFTEGLEGIANFGNACENTMTTTARNVNKMQTKIATADLTFENYKNNAISAFEDDLDTKNSSFLNELKTMSEKDQTIKTYQHQMEEINQRIAFQTSILSQEQEALQSQKENHNNTKKETIKEFQETNKVYVKLIERLKKWQQKFLIEEGDSEKTLMQKSLAYNQFETRIKRLEEMWSKKQSELQKELDSLDASFNTIQDKREINIKNTKKKIKDLTEQKAEIQERYDDERKTWS